MNTCLRSFAFTVLTVYCCAAQSKPTAEYWQALREGAAAKVTLKVAEQNGLAVSNANATVYFDMVNKNGNASRGSTDGEGLFSAEGLCADYAAITVTKQGYYDTRFRYDGIRSRDPERLKDGRWLPWNPTIPVVLREVRDPIPMYVKSVDAILPKGVFVGFDCLRGEFLPPAGNGETADFYILVEQDGVLSKDRKFSRRMALRSASEDGGFVFQASHLHSAFKSEYLAPLDGYRGTVDFYEEYPPDSALKPKVDPFDSGKHMVFRSRVKKDAKGNIVEAYHGKVYERMEYGRNARLQTDGESMVKFLYYFNPTPNDRNLEFDGKNNLFFPQYKKSKYAP